MKYEILKDKEDLYVLVINNIVVLISRDIYSITEEIHQDVQNREINPRRVYEPAVIDIEVVKEEEKEEEKEIKPLGRLFT